MTGLADVDGFKFFIQVCVWLRFQPLIAAIADSYISSITTAEFLYVLTLFTSTEILSSNYKCTLGNHVIIPIEHYRCNSIYF